VVAINGAGESPSGSINVQTTARPAKPSTWDRVRIFKKTSTPRAGSEQGVPLDSSVIGAESLAPSIFIKNDAANPSFRKASRAVFGRGFWGAEDLGSGDWLVDGISPASLNQEREFTLLTDEAQLCKIRPESAGFSAAYDGEYIDGVRRKTISNFSFYVPDSKPRKFFAEGCLLPGVTFNFSVLFYTQKNGESISGGARLYGKFFKKILDADIDAARVSESAMDPILGVDGSPYAVKATFPVSEEERYSFMVDIPASMEDTRTVLVVIAEVP
jgi:hypothetical protein